VLYIINEEGKFKDPLSLSPEKRKEQDEELFQKARLINCGFFV
jgi:linoleate 10R-lipoxygenase